MNIAAFTLGQLIAGGELDQGDAIYHLTVAAEAAGLGRDEIRRTLEHAIEDGKREPRTAPAPATSRSPKPTEPPEPVWTTPVPFPADNIEGAVRFPVHVLPEIVRNFVTSVAHFVQVDEALVAQDALGIGSFPVARKVVVLEGHWWEETNLWTIAAAPSGERKSAALRFVVAPVREVERERREVERQQIASEEAGLELLEQQYQAALKAAGRQEGDPDRIASETRARELSEQLSAAREDRTRATRLIVDDVTPEFFGRELAQNNPLLFASAEGGLLDNFLNRNSNIPNLDLLNASFSGDDYSPGRATRSAEPVRRPISCFALSPQPIIVAGLTTNPVLVARGTVSRFLFWFPRPRAGGRTAKTQELNEAHVAAWDSRMRELLSLTSPGEDPYRVRMSSEATAVMLPYRERIERDLGQRPPDESGITAWLNRASGQAQRLALVLHFLEHGVDAVSLEVGAEHAWAAVTLMDAYLGHAEIAFDLMDESKVLKRCRLLLGWLRKQNAAGKTVAVRDTHRAHQRWGEAGEIRDVLAELHARGWVWMPSRSDSDFLVHPGLDRLIGQKIELESLQSG